MTRMNPILRFFIVALLALSVASCGVPPLLNRTVNNTVSQIGALGSAQ
jgi:hypothetical protein